MKTHKWFSDFDAEKVVQSIDKDGAVSISNFLNDEIRLSLLKELKKYRLRKQPEVYGRYDVKQAFSSVEEFRRDSLFLQVKNEVEEFLREKFETCIPYPLDGLLQFTDIVVQRYPSGLGGISAHRDGKSFLNLVVVMVIEGTGRFCLCDDREMSNIRVVPNEAGSLILMRAVGFLGKDIQPFHFVHHITKKRTILALRQMK